jgi:hypothetical protein
MRSRSREETILIDASPESVFDLIHDCKRRLEWDPFLKEATPGPGILESFAATLRQDPVGNQTRVTYRYNFETRPRFLRPFLNIGCSIFFASEVCNRLRRLKQFLESGRKS